jgi:hypothetical protein
LQKGPVEDASAASFSLMARVPPVPVWQDTP